MEIISHNYCKENIKLNCYICENPGRLLYQEQQDKIFGVEGSWELLNCPQCQLIWLNPQPPLEEIHKYYRSYHTHEKSKLRWFMSPTNPIRAKILSKYFGYHQLEEFLGKNLIVEFLSEIPLLVEVVGMGILHLDASMQGKLLDVGCGTGQFLFSMQNLGWDVTGIEVDEQAALFARNQYSLNIFVGTLKEVNFPEKTFDIITISHVIEHVLDPIELLSECRRILKPSGKLILTTPNIESLGHRLFQENWRGLEVPRHMMIFSMKSLEVCVRNAGIEIETIQSTERLARDIYNASKEIQHQKEYKQSSDSFHPFNNVMGWSFQIFERIINSIQKKVGEEIFLIGIRDD